VAPATQQPHDHEARRLCRGGDVVVNDRRVAQGRQIQTTQTLVQERRLGVQQPINGHEIRIRTAQ
jgi:hypothetical protein